MSASSGGKRAKLAGSCMPHAPVTACVQRARGQGGRGGGGKGIHACICALTQHSTSLISPQHYHVCDCTPTLPIMQGNGFTNSDESISLRASKDRQQCIRPLIEYESLHLSKFEQVQVKFDPVRLVWGVRQHAAAPYTLGGAAEDRLLPLGHA